MLARDGDGGGPRRRRATWPTPGSTRSPSTAPSSATTSPRPPPAPDPPTRQVSRAESPGLVRRLARFAPTRQVRRTTAKADLTDPNRDLPRYQAIRLGTEANTKPGERGGRGRAWEDGAVSEPGPSVNASASVTPNVLASRYASPELRRDLVGRAQDRRRAAALDRRPHRAARPRGRRAGRGDRGVRRGRGPGRPRLDRRPRTPHPPRREGPDRGVLRPRRARAHPQGHDQSATSPRTSSSSRSATRCSSSAPRSSRPSPGSASSPPSTGRS